MAYAIGNEINLVLNWRWVFFLSGIFGIVLAPIVLITIKEKRQRNYSEVRSIQNKRGCAKKLDSFWKKGLLLLVTFIMPGMLMLCFAGGIRNAGGYVWAYNTQPFFRDEGYHDNVIASFMSVIPLVAGSIGAVVGGLVSDWLVKGRGPYVRIWVLIVSQVRPAVVYLYVRHNNMYQLELIAALFICDCLYNNVCVPAGNNSCSVSWE